MNPSKFLSQTLFIFCVTLLLTGSYSNAQDIRYTQAYNAPLRLNPALMARNTAIKGILNYRSQWANIANGFTTYRFSFLYPLIMNEDQGKLDIGLSAINDQAGVFNNLNISLALSYSLRISGDHHISAALMGGFAQTTVDPGDLTFDEQYVLGSFNTGNSNNELIVNETKNYPDLGTGLLWYFTPDENINAFAGVAVFHHNAPNQSLTGQQSDLSTSTNIHGGVKIIGDNFDVTPNVRFSQQGGAEEYSLGANIDYKINETMKIPVGLWYRYRGQNSFAAMLGFEHENFLVAYSYDLGSFTLIDAIPRSTTHEITLAFSVDQKEGNQVSSFE
ncbi:MAG: PorP/SprF family type IX secretion system membrane protein [Flavobacteriales bacterium]|nr:PorP/SprF family type IX secretion system membrane protein [Flavobacteriales bacterium]